jgi:hypothetical protein
MSQTPEPGQPARKRRWFQFHLSTAILLMVVAGGLMAMSFIPKELAEGLVLKFGWPWGCVFEVRYGLDRAFNWAVDVLPLGEWRYLALRYLALDIAALAVILFAVASPVEWLIRRQERSE